MFKIRNSKTLSAAILFLALALGLTFSFGPEPVQAARSYYRQSAPVRSQFNRSAQATYRAPVYRQPIQSSFRVGTLQTSRASLLSGTSLRSGMIRPAPSTIVRKTPVVIVPRTRSTLSRLSTVLLSAQVTNLKLPAVNVTKLKALTGLNLATRQVAMQLRTLSLRNKLKQQGIRNASLRGHSQTSVAGSPRTIRENNPSLFLAEALRQQGLSKAPSDGLKQKWSDGGYDYEVRIHPADPAYGKTGSVYRVARRSQARDSNGQGSGLEYMDNEGKWHPERTLKPGDPKNPNKDFDDAAAKNTHIQLPQ